MGVKLMVKKRYVTLEWPLTAGALTCTHLAARESFKVQTCAGTVQYTTDAGWVESTGWHRPGALPPNKNRKLDAPHKNTHRLTSVFRVRLGLGLD